MTDVLEWLEFIDEKSKEGMQMLANRNENIKVAYEILQRVSKSKEARMAYEARQAEIMDQLTREKSAREEGRLEEKLEISKTMLAEGIDINLVKKITGLTNEQAESLLNRL